MTTGTDTRIIYFLESESGLGDTLVADLEPFGYRVSPFQGMNALSRALDGEIPAAAILDVSFPRDLRSLASLAADVRAAGRRSLPLLLVSNAEDPDARLAAVRAGGDAFLTKPLNVVSLVDQLDRLTWRQPAVPYRVLVVDDDELICRRYALVLRHAGIEVATASNAVEAMDLLESFQPELVLLDLYMPGCSGLELAKVIRQHDAYLGTPIVFVSAEEDVTRQFDALRIGADDFLTKPLSDERLIAWVRIRASRARALTVLMDQDSLTGLLVHTRIKEQLAADVARAQREDRPLSFAMIDVDHFKQVNDLFGHLLGDHVLKSLARLLRQRLRQADTVGRYGGEEFALILPGCTVEDAGAVLEEIRQRFEGLSHGRGSDDFQTTFSAGVAGLPGAADAADLIRAADAALYRAKHAGRNRVVVAGV